MAGSSFLSFVEGDVGGKGRRCATAPAHHRVRGRARACVHGLAAGLPGRWALLPSGCLTETQNYLAVYTQFLQITQSPGKHTRSRPPFLLHSASPGATFLLPSFSVHAPTCLHCQTQIPLSEANKRFLRDLGITGPSGEHLPYWDQIPYTRFLFDFW